MRLSCLILFVFVWVYGIGQTQHIGINTDSPRSELEILSTDGKTVLNIVSPDYLADTTAIILRNRTSDDVGTEFRLQLANEEGLSLSSDSDLPGNQSENSLFVSPGGRVGLGTAFPQQKLDVDGRIKIGDDGSTPTAGTIRFNSTTNDFEGYNGVEWVSFTEAAPPPPSQGTDTAVVRAVSSFTSSSTDIRNAPVFPADLDSIVVPQSGTYLIGYYGSCDPENSLASSPTDVQWTLRPYVIQNGSPLPLTGGGQSFGNYLDTNGGGGNVRFVETSISHSFVRSLTQGTILKLGYLISANNTPNFDVSINFFNNHGMFIVRVAD